MIRRNTYVITGQKEWSMFYWNGVLVNCETKVDRHYRLVKICLDILNGKSVVWGLTRQYGFTAAMEQAKNIKTQIS